MSNDMLHDLHLRASDRILSSAQISDIPGMRSTSNHKTNLRSLAEPVCTIRKAKGDGTSLIGLSEGVNTFR